MEGNIHLQAIRQALANGNAAVMVGSGFSRNAVGGHRLALWSDLASELGKALGSAGGKNFSAGQVTRLGEQYSRVFSRSALDEVLKRMVPDDRVEPGALHQRLLRLPWCEIFTTNYDTLLERAAEDILDRAHLTVCCREDIPQSKILSRRRIVKLHGSFPSTRPFIFTDEDYRTYPQRFAPFVNLVRQSLLENVFCLIGFSGDDPNFLNWIGWVRDMLDQHTLPIYMLVSSAPSLGERMLLESRNVIPVELPKEKDTDNNDFIARFNLLFDQLEERTGDDLPWSWLTTASGRSYVDSDDGRYHNLIADFENLSEHRLSYPGWFVAPSKVRRRVLQRMRGHDLSPIQHLPRLCQDDVGLALAIAAHYAWLQEVCLQPLEDTFATEAISLLERSTGLQWGSQSLSIKARWKKVGLTSQQALKDQQLELALSLARWARQAMDEQRLRRLSDLIDRIAPRDSFAIDELRYEEVLLLLYRGQRHEARHSLSAWQPNAGSLFSFVHKGALLAELGEAEVGLSLCQGAIQSIRRAQRLAPDSHLLSSQETWATMVAHNISQSRQFWRDKRTAISDSSADADYGERMSDLAAKGFDAVNEVQTIQSELNAEVVVPMTPRYRASGFDMHSGTIVQNLGMSYDMQEKVLAAFSWLTLAERVGLPPRIDNVTFNLDSYMQAAWWSQYGDTVTRMLSVVVRTLDVGCLGPIDDNKPPHKTGWLSRFQIATLPLSLAMEMAERSLRQVETALSPAVAASEAERVSRFHIEVFSRLALRADSETASSFFRRVASLHLNNRLQELDQNWGAFATALRRCWEAIAPESRTDLVPTVLRLPLPPASNHNRQQWVQPFDLQLPLGSRASSEASIDIRAAADSLCSQISDTQSHSSSEEHTFLWHRLLWIESLGLLPDNIRERLGQIVWGDTSPWPVIPGFRPSVTLSFCSDRQDGVSRFRRYALEEGISYSRNSPGLMRLQLRERSYSWNLPLENGTLFSWLRSLDDGWPDEDVRLALEQISAWWADEGSTMQADASASSELADALSFRLRILDLILAKLMLTSSPAMLADDVWNATWRWVEQARVVAPLWAFRVVSDQSFGDQYCPSSVDAEIAQAFLLADSNALIGLQDALRIFLKKPVAETHLHATIAVCVSVIATRRIASLSIAIDSLTLICQAQDDCLTAIQRSMVSEGMRQMLQELSYLQRPAGTGIPDGDVPHLRLQCLKLAYALKGDDTSTMEWQRSAKFDPLPEMRYFVPENS